MGAARKLYERERRRVWWSCVCVVVSRAALTNLKYSIDWWTWPGSFPQKQGQGGGQLLCTMHPLLLPCRMSSGNFIFFPSSMSRRRGKREKEKERKEKKTNISPLTKAASGSSLSCSFLLFSLLTTSTANILCPHFYCICTANLLCPGRPDVFPPPNCFMLTLT